MALVSNRFQLFFYSYWSSPRSLVTTSGVSIDFFSSGYLDISVHLVRYLNLCIQFKLLYNSDQRLEFANKL